MEFHTKIQYLNPEKGRRVIAVSDIHGHRDWLKRLLDRVGFCEEDILVIVGDMTEKGPESLETIRYIMELSKKYEVYPLLGNVDLWRLEMLLDETGSLDEELYRTNERMGRVWESTLLNEMCEELNEHMRSAVFHSEVSAVDEEKGIAENEAAIGACDEIKKAEDGRAVPCVRLQGPEDVAAIRKAVTAYFQAELDFLKNLPTILETPKFTFVHGGLVCEKLEDNLQIPLDRLLKNDDFVNQGKYFSKYVVVGHWPVCLYDGRIDCSAPYVSREKRILSIDGGCGLKRDGQLNALIIPDLYEEEWDWDSYDDFPEVIALDDQEGSPKGESINIRYYDSKVKILEPGEEFSLAEHVKSGYRLRMYNPFLEEPPVVGEIIDCWEYTDYRLPVRAGDKLSLIQSTSEGCLMKKRGVSGWYFGRFTKQQ